MQPDRFWLFMFIDSRILYFYVGFTPLYLQLFFAIQKNYLPYGVLCFQELLMDLSFFVSWILLQSCLLPPPPLSRG
jgi:hypothetical protein